MTQNQYKAEYNASSFWSKIKKYAKKAGSAVVEASLQMYFALQDSDTPLWAKTVIIGALGYFISPLDIIPDALPVAGYSDDLTVLTGALATVATHIKPEHKRLAKEKFQVWFS